MAKNPSHKWTFRARFRRSAFGWQSAPAIQRIQEAVAEIKLVAGTDPELAAEGAVIFIEKLSPALEHVDGSSGAIGAAVNSAIAELATIIGSAPTEPATRDKWLDRLWQALEDDDIPYIERLGDHWGEICGSPEVAARWADLLMTPTKEALNPKPATRVSFNGTACCLSALLAAKRYDEVLKLLEPVRLRAWFYRPFGIRALVAMGRIEDALIYAEQGEGAASFAATCEDLLLSLGRVDEAYERYGLAANSAHTHLAWFRAVSKKYPHKTPAQVLTDLAAHTPGEEGKWFAAAKSAKLFDEAIALANRTPCSPQTLTRASRDFAEKNPSFAIEAGMTALRWLGAGFGYKVTGVDILAAYEQTMAAATVAGRTKETHERICQLVSSEAFTRTYAKKVLAPFIGQP